MKTLKTRSAKLNGTSVSLVRDSNRVTIFSLQGSGAATGRVREFKTVREAKAFMNYPT